MRVMWMIMCACCVAWANADLEAKELSPRDIYEQASPAVVMVMGHSDGGKTGSGGTGSIIQADGLVLTNAHVVVEERTGKPYPRLSVFLKPPRVTGDSRMDLARMLRAKVVAYSTPLDLAILKSRRLLRRCRLSRSASPRMAESVIESSLSGTRSRVACGP